MPISAYLDALRAQLEPYLVCRCGVRNQYGIRTVLILDIHAQTVCEACGCTGPVQDFQQES